MPRTIKPSTLVAASLISFALILALGASIAALALISRPADGIPGGGSLFAVERGETAGVVADRLERERLIRSSLVFKLLMRIKGGGSAIKAGTYRIAPSMGTVEILDVLESGRQATVRVTIPEGSTIRQVAARLEDAGVASAAEFTALCSDPAFASELGIAAPSLEGYLFPDTYLLPLGYGPRKAAAAMTETFMRRMAALPETAALSAAELHERLILASIVEREYRLSEEAPIMASVFLNRLRIGMALQSCATVVYVITEKRGRIHPERLFDIDLQLQDPFNTYIHRGLPPGPICNPGMTAVTAALRPAVSPYLYFRLVDESTGLHHFSETLEEHVGARSLFVKGSGG